MEAKELKKQAMVVVLPTKKPGHYREMFYLGGTTSRPKKTRWTTSVARCADCGELFRKKDDPTLYVTPPVCLHCAGMPDEDPTSQEYNIPEYILDAPELVQKMADVIVREIILDIKVGVIPDHVESFAELHNYTDANMYGLDVIQHLLGDPVSCEWAIEQIANRAQNVANAWIKARWALIRSAANPVEGK